MSILAEFVGGPLDGEIRELPEALPVIYWPRVPRVSALVIVPVQLLPLMEAYRYVRSERRETPAGGLIFRYRLEGS